MSDSQVERIEWDRDAPHPLGRHVSHDPRSRMFAAPLGAEPTTDKRHRVLGSRLDQGTVGACTGFTAAAALNTLPVRTAYVWRWRKDFGYRTLRSPATMRNADGLDFYRGATRRDPWPEVWEPDDIGSSGLAAAQTLLDVGKIARYEHAFGFQHGLRVIMERPLMQGSYWTYDMFEPDSTGRVRPTGGDAGGHEYLWVGIELRSKLTRADNRSWFVNSWANDWGVNGYFWMSWDDHDALLQRDGDLIAVV